MLMLDPDADVKTIALIGELKLAEKFGATFIHHNYILNTSDVESHTNHLGSLSAPDKKGYLG